MSTHQYGEIKAGFARQMFEEVTPKTFSAFQSMRTGDRWTVYMHDVYKGNFDPDGPRVVVDVVSTRGLGETVVTADAPGRNETGGDSLVWARDMAAGEVVKAGDIKTAKEVIADLHSELYKLRAEHNKQADEIKRLRAMPIMGGGDIKVGQTVRICSVVSNDELARLKADRNAAMARAQRLAFDADELRRDRERWMNAYADEKQAHAMHSNELRKTNQDCAILVAERDQFKARVAELEQDLSIVRGDLATANQRATNAERSRMDALTRNAAIAVTEYYPASLHARLQKAERKAAKANTELEACRKNATALAYVVEGRNVVSDTCMCDECAGARAALEYLKVGKAKG